MVRSRNLLFVATLAITPACRNDPAPIAVDTSAPAPAHTYEANATVMFVIDGDTVVADIGGAEERVRLIGIDAPETHLADQPPECYGPEATDHTEALLPVGTGVYLERDAEPRDQYDRLLGYVFRADDGLFVNADLGRQGFVRSLWYSPNFAYRSEVDGAIAEARAAGRGLWGACPQQ